MTYLQNALNEGAMAIMLKDAIASINYFNYYKQLNNKNYEKSNPIRSKRVRN